MSSLFFVCKYLPVEHGKGHSFLNFFINSFFQCHGQCYGACHYVHLLWIVSSAIFEEVPLVEETPNTDSNGRFNFKTHEL